MIDPIQGLRRNIRKLAPEGQEGFEGLMAAVLSAATGRSFVLASSGTQRGRDGQSFQDDGEILFEAKRYDEAIPKDKLFTKVFELAADRATRAELFVVGATCSISSQHISTLEEGTRRLGLALLIAAWSETALPDLPVLLAMTATVSVDFLARHTEVAAAELRAQLDVVAAHAQFADRSAALKRALDQPSIAPPLAVQTNRRWLEAAFSSQRRARAEFGQALSPADPSTPGVLDRAELRARVAELVFAKPDGALVAILGADGNGKSWIFAQAWRYLSAPPLTLIVVPEDVTPPVTIESCRDLLVAKLHSQSGETPTRESEARWLRHFERWCSLPRPDEPRFIVFVDGANQRASVDWLRFLDAMGELVDPLGGRVVFSCRQLFYRDRLEGRTISEIVSVDVPEWSDAELETLLARWGATIASLEPDVVRSLHNPRIFAVAAKLLSAQEVASFDELSVSRLLFEHIRSGSAVAGIVVSPSQFAAEICDHADAIVRQLQQADQTELSAFDVSNQPSADRFTITAASRFFEVLEENPNKYVLREEGLPLALGLALVRAAQTADRRGASVDAALAAILDPITALDRTSEILLGAIVGAVVQDLSPVIVAPLVRAAVQLQNVSDSHFPEFRNLFASAPTAFLTALEACLLSSDATANFSWLTEALVALRGNDQVETALVPALHRWLSLYSLAPERGLLMPATLDGEEERQTNRAEQVQKLAKETAGLSASEQELLNRLPQEDGGDYSQLNLLAFEQLAGRPLALFAESLRNWCFANALNGGFRDHSDAFDDLLHFNLVDWSATRDALRSEAAVLRGAGVSTSGQWALVALLRATGDSDDALEAEHLAEELTKDREKFGGWRLVEKYCATDPCDPASARPDNVDATADQYTALDPAKLRRGLLTSQEDIFFEMAKAGLARFRPDAALSTLRALAEQALCRDPEQFRLATFLLEPETVGLRPSIAPRYVDKAREIAKAVIEAGEDRHREGWVAAQHALCIAFPHLNGREQFDALLSRPPDEDILLELGRLCRPIESEFLEEVLSRAFAAADPVAQFRILVFADNSETLLTPGCKALVLQLLGSEDKMVRLAALSLIHHQPDPELLSGLIASDWSAAKLDAVTRKMEIFHGSQALVAAVRRGMLSVEACLERIAFSAYDSFVEALGDEAALAISDRLNLAIRKAGDFEIAENLPDISQNLEGRFPPVIYEVTDRSNDRGSADSAAFKKDAWYERHERNREAAYRFEMELTRAGARIIIDAVTPRLVAAIVRAAPQQVDAWCTYFLRATPSALSNIHNIATMVAGAVTSANPLAAVKLFRRLEASAPHVRQTYGLSEISLDAVTVWEAADSEMIRALRFGRLDSAGNDYALSLEVLAAARAGRSALVRDYVLDRLARPEPAHRARAVMVAAFARDEAWARETLAALADERGFLGRAYEAARYAFERHQWSLHWAAAMRDSTTPDDLWRNAVLLAEIVDGRFQRTDVEGNVPNDLIRRFGATLNSPIRRRIGKWKSKREGKLFGMNAPNPVFLGGSAGVADRT